MPRTRWNMNRLYASLLPFVVLLGVAHEAPAHGVLLESSPRSRETVASVKQLDLRFNSRLERAFSHLRLAGLSGEQVSLEAVPSETAGPNRLRAGLPPLGPGLYTVHWRILTVDGHVTQGNFSFRIAERR